MGMKRMTHDQAMASVERRWSSLVNRGSDDDCWPWVGYINPVTGYGQLAVSGALTDAGWHRTCTAPWVSCRLHHGPPPDGHEVLHSCANRVCCNPAHLRWGTHAQNMQDRVIDGGQNTRKLTPDNVRSIRLEFANRSTGKMVAYEHLAEKYGVSVHMVRNVVAGRSWGWLDE